MTPSLIEQIIRNNVELESRPNTKGFFATLCKVCNDHGKKGKRAGFTFSNGAVGYNCFNCGTKASFDPSSPDGLTKTMVDVLSSFGVSQGEIDKIYFSLLGNQPVGAASPKVLDLTPQRLSLPPFFVSLGDSTSPIAEAAKDYLAARNVDWTQYPFMLADKSDHPAYKKWAGRIIIPTFKDDHVIFYQGRDLLDDGTRKKYLSAAVPRDNVLYGYDKLNGNRNEPLYVVEGWFDAYHIGGVAVYGNVMTPNQIAILNRCPRPKVIIPDRFGDGSLLAEQAIRQGWGVSLPDIGSCKDISDAITRYGKLYTLMSIAKHTYTDEFEATAHVGVYCDLPTVARGPFRKR